ncbi:MAG: glutaredoxin family protein [Dehalococcoidia bacterium]|jgi:glutaredoxin|uniref:Glutaredoxin domain-containing protein n=1 Tax=marine metagenome TaxID=408172 RepID=A0A381U0H0_9ZZZZ|nr:NrdH-redoxin [Chloroflexota bacterium]MBV46118.1 NrdH-redoxin [Dehalococcoidia bacterium]MCH2313624.1 glutaredoxin family protein [SAR202 cluster bacterium]MCS5647749.1 glutaredoxin family protein [Dehalococcoidia bacterium]MEC7914578.1 glutaredoxin family protein [Chloroflexota bacterium]|tara:strand:- start:112 stop:309 length:198 start_codon:yes stop_codon:yes gene_type:complete
MVKVYLSRKGFEYTEHNVSTDRDSLKDLVSMGYRSTPVTVIGEEKVVGYSPAKLDEALEAAGLSS